MEAVDLSVGGIGLIADLRTGQHRKLELVLLERSVSVEGVVRYEAETPDAAFRVGIEFVEPQPELEEVALLLSDAKN